MTEEPKLHPFENDPAILHDIEILRAKLTARKHEVKQLQTALTKRNRFEQTTIAKQAEEIKRLSNELHKAQFKFGGQP